MYLLVCVVCTVRVSESATCSWTDKSSGQKLDLGAISGTDITGTESGKSFEYHWYVCENGYQCSGDDVMAAQYNPGNGNCNTLAYTDSSTTPTYSSGKWSFSYENGATCSGSARKLDIVITCSGSTSCVKT